LAFRFPAPFLSFFPDLDAIPIAKHPTQDPSVPAIAHHDAAPQITPYVPVEPHIAKQWRLYYMATIAWMDSQLGRVLDELETLGHHDDTLVGKIVILSRFACCPSLANPKTYHYFSASRGPRLVPRRARRL